VGLEADLVLRMEAQHRKVAANLERVGRRQYARRVRRVRTPFVIMRCRDHRVITKGAQARDLP
jgi:hypothetical protein